jgi:hypothetical protein
LKNWKDEQNVGAKEIAQVGAIWANNDLTIEI